MQEITEENIDELVAATDDPEMLKELIIYAVKFEREDLVATIVGKTVQNNQLLKKLQEYELNAPDDF